MNPKPHIIVTLSLTSLLIALFCLLYDPFKLILPVRTIYFKEPNTTNCLPNRVVSNLDNYEEKYFYHCSKKLPPGYVLYNFSAKEILGAHIYASFDCDRSDGEFSTSYSLDDQTYHTLNPVRQIKKSYEYLLDFKSEKIAASNLWLKASLCGRQQWCNLYSYSAEVYSLPGAKKSSYVAAGFFIFYFVGAFLLMLFLITFNRKIMRRIFLVPEDNSRKMSCHLAAIFSLFLLFPILRALWPAYFNFSNTWEIYSLSLLFWRIAFLLGIFGLIAYTAVFASKAVLGQMSEYRISLFVLLACFFYGVLYFFNNQLSGDGALYYSGLRSVFIDHDIDFRNEAAYIKAAGWANGVTIIPTRMGTCLIWLPAYALTHYILLFCKTLHVTCFELDGWSLPYITSITFMSLIASFCGLMLSYKLLRRFFGFSVSLLSAVMVYLGTPIFTWTFVHPSYTHAIDYFVISLFVYYWVITATGRTLKQWLILGAIFFLTLLVREQNVLLGVVVITEGVKRYANRDKETFRHSRFLLKYVFFMVSAAGGMAFLVLVALKGGFIQNFPYVSNGFKLDISSSLQVMDVMLFSTTHGFLTITPLIVISFIGLVFSAWVYDKNRKPLFFVMICCLLMFVVQFAYLALFAPPSVLQFNIGARYFINSTFLFMLGLGFLFEYISRNRLASISVKTVCWIAVIYYLFINIQYQGHVINYFGEGSPWKLVLKQQIDMAYLMIPDVLTKRIFWSEPKLIFYLAETGKGAFFYGVFLIILLVTCFAIFKRLMLSTEKKQ